MSIFSESHGQISLFHLHGHIDKQAAAELDEQLAAAFEEGAVSLVFDFSSATHIGSDGLKVILGVLKRVQERGGRVIHAGVNAEVRSLLNVAGFLYLLEEFETIDAAIAAMQ